MLFGVTIGIGLILGLWLPAVIELAGVPLRAFYPTLIIGSLPIVIIAGLTGLISSRFSHAGLSALAWFGAALAIASIIGSLLYQVQTVASWLIDRQFWGQTIHETSSVSRLRGGFAGFFIVFLLTVYGLMQENRLDGLRGEISERAWLTGRGWFLLLLGLVPIVAVGIIANTIVLKPVYAAPAVVHQAINVARTTNGDLFALSQQEGVNYNAFKDQRDDLAGPYTLQIGQIEWGPINTIYVMVEFESGVWLVCHVMNERLSHCNDASLPYFVGFRSLLRMGELPADCMACRFRVTESQQVWLSARQDQFVNAPRDPVITKVAQMGSVVLLQAQADASEHTDTKRITCLFKGVAPIVLESCWEIGP